MDMILLMGLLLVTVVGFLVGCVVGFVLGHDIAVARQERKKTPDLTVKAVRAREWDEDLTNPEGEWHG